MHSILLLATFSPSFLVWPALLPLLESQVTPVSERSSSTVAAQFCWVFSAADFRFPFFLASSVCFQVYRTVFYSICPWRLMIKEQKKQMTKMKTLPPTSVRFQGRTRRGWGESEHICSIPRLLPDTSLRHVTLTSPCDPKLLPGARLLWRHFLAGEDFLLEVTWV